MTGKTLTHLVKITKTDAEKRIVYGEVYPPLTLDAHGEFMFPEDVELMAHRFMSLDLKQSIDQEHDNVATGSYPVESFIAREGDPDFTPGAWVMGTKIDSDEVWARVQAGDLNTYSFEAMVRPLKVEIEVDAVRDRICMSSETDGHEHVVYVQCDDLGRVVRGWTDIVGGHSHAVFLGTATEKTGGHSHRFFL